LPGFEAITKVTLLPLVGFVQVLDFCFVGIRMFSSLFVVEASLKFAEPETTSELTPRKSTSMYLYADIALAWQMEGL
jgi:hypothetical protein